MESFIFSFIWCPIVIIFFLFIVLMIRREIRRYEKLKARIAEIKQAEHAFVVIDYWDMRAQIEILGKRADKPVRTMLTISEERLALFERNPQMPEVFSFTSGQIRWFGRPNKYTNGRNEIWLHIEKDPGWVLLRIWLYTDSMRDLVRALKAITPPELTTAYRRKRPYVHSGLLKARPATQDIHGAWTVGDAYDLYLMPRYLLILSDNKLMRKIPLEAVQEIGALRRIDQPKADG